MRSYQPAKHGVVITPRLTSRRLRTPSGPGPIIRSGARIAGLLDALRGIPLTGMPLGSNPFAGGPLNGDPAAGGRVPGAWPTDAAGRPVSRTVYVWTAYINRAHRRVGALASRLNAELVGTQEHSLRRLYAYAQEVRAENGAFGAPSTATAGRFVALLAALQAVATSSREQVEAAAADADQAVSCYWEALARHHRQLRPPKRRDRGPDLNDPRRWHRPAPYVLDPVWRDANVILLASFGPAAGGGPAPTPVADVLLQAIDIVTRIP